MAADDRLTVRGVSDEDQRVIEDAARRNGTSKNGYLAGLIRHAAARERNNSAFRRVAELPAEGLGEPDTAAAVRQLRDDLAAGSR